MPKKDNYPLLDISALSSDGQGLGRITSGADSGLVVFVPGALPGERVRIKIGKRSRNYLRAEIVEPIRLLPQASCPHAALCGGCSLARMPYAEQLHWKQDFVSQAMLRTGKLPSHHLEQFLASVIASPDIGCYRNKMEFAFAADKKDGHLLLGQRAFHSHEILATPDCERMPKIVQTICEKVAELCSTALPPSPSDTKGHAFWRFLVVRQGFLPESHTQAFWLLFITSPGKQRERDCVRKVCEQLLAIFPEIACLVHEERKADDQLAVGEKRVLVLGKTGNAQLALPLGGRFFRLDVDSFFQINSQASQILAQQVLSQLSAYAGKNRDLLDLFCGVGAPGLLLADNFRRVLGIEVQALSVACAQTNAQSFHCHNYQAQAGACRKLMASVQKADVLLCDPPRTGLEPETLMAVLKRDELQAICYVSCNPATLARDLLRLSERFQVERIVPLDLFPHTPHVETIVLLSRTKR